MPKKDPTPPKKLTIESTTALIQKAFDGQVDKAGKPTYLHSIAVMERLPEDAPLCAQFAALLHDVLEDTKVGVKKLRKKGYDEETLAIVELLTKPENPKDLSREEKNQRYLTWVEGIIASGNEWAIRIKYADICENCSAKRMNHLSADEQERLRNKWGKPMQLLHKAVRELDGATAEVDCPWWQLDEELQDKFAAAKEDQRRRA